MVFYWMRNKRTEIDMKILDYKIWPISLKNHISQYVWYK